MPSPCYFGGMKKARLAVQEARRLRIPPETAADQMDRVVHELLQNLRSGRAAELPGLGSIQPGRRWRFVPEKGKS